MEKIEELLVSGLEQLDLNLPEGVGTRLFEYAKLLFKWNQTYNLTAATTLKEIIIKHLLDSLSIVKYVVGQRVLDVGTGAGLPGIPLALCLPDYEFVLLDSVGKKINFLNHLKHALPLPNVDVVKERVEKFKFVNCFATIVTRAFSALDAIIDKTKHLYCADGQLLAMKGKYPEGELAALKDIELSLDVKVIDLVVPYLKQERHLVCIKGINCGQDNCNC